MLAARAATGAPLLHDPAVRLLSALVADVDARAAVRAVRFGLLSVVAGHRRSPSWRDWGAAARLRRTR
jgi:hypothetical protein